MTMRRSGRPHELSRCVDWIHDAGSVLVVGSTGAAPLAPYLTYAISKVRSSVQIATSPMSTPAWLQINNTGPELLVILTGFPRYQRWTVEIGEYEEAQVPRSRDYGSLPVTAGCSCRHRVPDLG